MIRVLELVSRVLPNLVANRVETAVGALVLVVIYLNASKDVAF
jgi:hypothetical protein